MRVKAAALWLSAGGLAVLVGGCGGGPAGTCGGGPACGGADAGADAPREVGQPDADGAPPPTCGSVQPCGGDVVGDWSFVQECESPAHIAAIEADYAQMAEPTWCAIQRLVGVEPQASGSLRLDADGTYALDLVFGGYLDINYPASCLIGLGCDETTMELQSEVDAGTYPVPSVSSISCSGASSCLCRATVYSDHAESGTYALAGSVLTLTATTGAVTNESVCVAGGALHLLETSIGSSGETDVDSDLVAMKQ